MRARILLIGLFLAGGTQWVGAKNNLVSGSFTMVTVIELRDTTHLIKATGVLNEESLSLPESSVQRLRELDYTGDLFKYNMITGSNVLPFSMMGKMAFGGYIDGELTSDIESKLKGENRAGFYQSISLGVYPLKSRFSLGTAKSASTSSESLSTNAASQGGKKLLSIGIRNVQSAGLNFSDDAFRLVFRGNGYYKGRELNIGDNRLQSMGYNAIDFRFDASSLKATTFYLSLLQVTNYSRLQTSDMQLYTSARGDSLSFNGRYFSQSTRNLDFGQKGLGISFSLIKSIKFRGLGTYKQSGKQHLLVLGVMDLGVLQVSSVAVESRGYIWDASGKGLNPTGDGIIKSISLKQAVVSAKELQLSNWFGNQKDSALANLNLVNQERTGVKVTPFTVFAEVPRFQFLGKQMGAQMNYLNVYGYSPFMKVWLDHSIWPKSNQKWTNITMQPSFSLGGFDTWNLGMTINFLTPIRRMGSTFFVLDIRGVEAWIAPNKQHGAGLMAAVIFRL